MKRTLVGICCLCTALLVQAAPFVVEPSSVAVEVVVKAPMDSFTAKLEKAEVTAVGDPVAGGVTKADVRFNWTDLKTGKPGRDKAMLEWCGADKNPSGHFTLGKIAPAGDGAFSATGTLELAGQSHEITFPVKSVLKDQQWTLSGEAAFDHRNWGLPKIRKFGMLTVDPNVVVKFSFALKPAP